MLRRHVGYKWPMSCPYIHICPTDLPSVELSGSSFPPFFLQTPLHSIPHIPHHDIRSVYRLLAVNKNPTLHENTPPFTPRRTHKFISTLNIALRVIPNHINPLQPFSTNLRPPCPKKRVSMPFESLFRKSKCLVVWFPKHSLLQLSISCDSFPHTLESFAETTLAETREVIRCCPEEIRV